MGTRVDRQESPEGNVFGGPNYASKSIEVTGENFEELRIKIHPSIQKKVIIK